MTTVQTLPPGMSSCLVRFASKHEASDIVLAQFPDPTPCFAVLADEATGAAEDTLLVRFSPMQASAAELQGLSDAGEEPPLHVRHRDWDVWLNRGHAVVRCAPEQAAVLLPALIDFVHYDRELRRMEAELIAAWPSLDEDNLLAFESTVAGLRDSKALGERMQRTLRRRIHLARIAPRLYAPPATFLASARALGEALREAADTESRVEAADEQIEVFENSYEMSSQKMGEFRAAHEGQIIEWLIVGLLVAETVVMLIQTLSHRH